MKTRFGVVGCGRISTKHIEAISTNPEAELTAVCDVEPTEMLAAGKGAGARVFSDFREMLSSGGFDVVSICTPSGLHSEQAILAARAGYHVISEKPMATTWADGLSMVRACKEAGVRLFVVKQNRFNPTLIRLKDAIEQGRFGKIYLIQVNVFWSRPQSYYDQAPWRGTWALDGGALMNQASHYVDLLTWCAGPLKRVHAMTRTLARKIEAEDTAIASLEWRSGAIGSLNVTMLTYPKNYEGSFCVMGETGTVKVGGVAVNQIDVWKFADARPEDLKIQNASYGTESVYGNGHVPFYAHVLEALRGSTNPVISGEEGLRSLETLCGLYESAKTGAWVELAQ